MSSDSDDDLYYYKFKYKEGIISFQVVVDCADVEQWLEFARGERSTIRMDIYPTEGGAPTVFRVSNEGRNQYGEIVDIQLDVDRLREEIGKQLIPEKRIYYS